MVICSIKRDTVFTLLNTFFSALLIHYSDASLLFRMRRASKTFFFFLLFDCDPTIDKSNEKWKHETIRHYNARRPRRSEEIVIPAMGSDLKGRFDGASRPLPRCSLSLLEIHFSGLFIRGRCRGDESEVREVNFPAVHGKL